MSIKETYHAAQGLLARREHSQLELEQKLTRKDHELSDVLMVIERLKEQGFQSNQRYAESCFRSRANKGYGPNFIRQYLQQRGISDSLAYETEKNSDINWFDCIKKVWEKKYLGAPQDIKSTDKQKNFLYYRGFDARLISQLFNDIK